jgi:hypothetical protein
VDVEFNLALQQTRLAASVPVLIMFDTALYRSAFHRCLRGLGCSSSAYCESVSPFSNQEALMKYWKSAALCCVVSALFLTVPLLARSPAEDKSGQATETQTKKLVERIEQLETRVAQLERMQALITLPARQAQQPLPEGSVRNQINGIEYYIIPVETSDSPTTKPAK